jgi:hypothetical protein
MIKLSHLVCGTGRCGTVSMSEILTQLGLPCGHESVFTPEGITHALAVLAGQQPIENSRISNKSKTSHIVSDSSYMAAPFLGHPSLSNCKIIHVIRNPLEVINSFTFGFRYFSHSQPEALTTDQVPGNRWQLFIYSHMPELRKEMNTFERAALYYLNWNKLIKEKSIGKPYYLHRIEDDISGICKFLGVELQNINVRANVTERVGAIDFVPEGTIKNRLRQFASEHGYSI